MTDQPAKILAAARKCVHEKGFHNTSVHSIAEQAGISTGLIYRYFKNKDAVIEALVSSITHELISISMRQDSVEKATMPFHLAAENHNQAVQHFEQNIVLLMNISAEAARTPHYETMIGEAFSQLLNHVLSRKRQSYPDDNESVLATQLTFAAVMIDGLIIRRRLKGNPAGKVLTDAVQSILQRVDTH
ncbi:TetR/AcrR family transcriptional regulator [Erwinia mallotivora]|uniref:TetR/AcrR family transcriptional regulator n=1 Tax=Erwinia mallotivora TaxID=69222 RepID=UPI0035E9F782